MGGSFRWLVERPLLATKGCGGRGGWGVASPGPWEPFYNVAARGYRGEF